jgi:hypothetical protein
MRDDWSPRTTYAGLKRIAIIVPESEFAKISIDAIKTKLENSHIETIYFVDISKAKEWLLAG